MGRPSLDGHREGSRPLAAGLEGTALGRRFEHEHRTRGPRASLEKCAGLPRTHFLVGGEEDLHPGAVLEGCDGVDGLDDARLHVEHARPGGPAVAHGEGADIDGAGGMHRVVVSEYQDTGVLSAAPVDVWTGR